ncbi:NAD(P) transhydrogenase subunit alpha [Desulfobacula sp.]|uniref:NAD(P) transhydrogenase subunit alpha n=1 Tax=Desulfobacula sp. TaxID=2593537 RepID=UPI0025C47A92|nr:NAD(P) transhydrogenase subunit alpha [Desulfobacula sp.]MBC2705799.1 NAD(P) transhydrogenase subunit alpha [Desulfobacula sp.]
MLIGIPKEIMYKENRVAALPETIEKFKKLGVDVLVETKAGAGAFADDGEYRKAGAQIAADAAEVFDRSDVILKVKEPMFNEQFNKHEIDMLKENQILITFLHPAAPSNHGDVKRLQERNITAFTMDGIPRISRAQRMDPLTSMSAITGYKSIIIAAANFPKFVPMIGTSIGMIKPANILVIGTGVVGLQAIATGKRLGGVVKAVDIRPAAKEEAASVGAKVVNFDPPSELVLGEGGYAKALPEEWLEKERQALAPIVAESDIIILSALVPGEVAQHIITKKMVETMKPGSVIIDVSIDQGGNCEMTDPGKELMHNGVYICGIKNIPGSVPVHSSWLYANNLYYFVENLFKNGADEFDMTDEIIKGALVTHKGKLYHEGTLKAMGLNN